MVRLTSLPPNNKSDRVAGPVEAGHAVTASEVFNELAGLLDVAFRVFVSDPAASNRHGATPAQLRVLQLLDLRPGIPVTEVARSLVVTAPTASVTLARLESHGWVERSEDPSDARSRLFRLSRTGRAVLKAFQAVQMERVKRLLDRFYPDEIETFRSLSARASQAIAELYGESALDARQRSPRR